MSILIVACHTVVTTVHFLFICFVDFPQFNQQRLLLEYVSYNIAVTFIHKCITIPKAQIWPKLNNLVSSVNIDKPKGFFLDFRALRKSTTTSEYPAQAVNQKDLTENRSHGVLAHVEVFFCQITARCPFLW